MRTCLGTWGHYVFIGQTQVQVSTGFTLHVTVQEGPSQNSDVSNIYAQFQSSCGFTEEEVEEVGEGVVMEEVEETAEGLLLWPIGGPSGAHRSVGPPACQLGGCGPVRITVSSVPSPRWAY